MASQTFVKDVSFSYSDFDIHDFVFPSAYFQALQDLAGEHAETFGAGYEAMKAKGLMWIIVRGRIDVFSNPKESEPCLLFTRAKKPIGIQVEREFKLTSKVDGRTILTGLTVWCIANRTTRRLVRPSSVQLLPSYDDSNAIYKSHLTGIPEFEAKGDPVAIHQVVFTDLDHNLHMNNCKYADVILNAISPKDSQRLSVLEIDFERECQEGDRLSVYLSDPKPDNTRFIKAVKADGKTSFKATFRLIQDDSTR